SHNNPHFPWDFVPWSTHPAPPEGTGPWLSRTHGSPARPGVTLLGTILFAGTDGSTQRVPRPPVNTPRAPAGLRDLLDPPPAQVSTCSPPPGHPASPQVPSCSLPRSDSSSLCTSPHPHVPQAPLRGCPPTCDPKSCHHGPPVSPQDTQLQDGGTEGTIPKGSPLLCSFPPLPQQTLEDLPALPCPSQLRIGGSLRQSPKQLPSTELWNKLVTLGRDRTPPVPSWQQQLRVGSWHKPFPGLSPELHAHVGQDFQEVSPKKRSGKPSCPPRKEPGVSRGRDTVGTPRGGSGSPGSPAPRFWGGGCHPTRCW
ncbi:proline-rich receptor-like protein kinase PERK2, partial [Motacilla alba alba]|uniref:proline-rich receptor-like protein kinase PERK2 n=1 Tax=Motacilla alba alba TaxID=1094192 RepID=UPI0018D5957D